MPEDHRRDRADPGLLTAGFSSLAPGTYIGPHFGYTNEVLRAHLSLLPSDDSAIRVGPETRAGGRVEKGDEAWNRGKDTRVVLLLDFKRDPTADVRYPEHVYAY